MLKKHIIFVRFTCRAATNPCCIPCYQVKRNRTGNLHQDQWRATKEIAYWRFLDTWSGHLRCLDERHLVLTFHVDASNTGWCGIVFPLEGETSGWNPYTQGLVTEVYRDQRALSLLYTSCCRGFTLIQLSYQCPRRQPCFCAILEEPRKKCSELTEVIKSISDLSFWLNIGLSLYHILPAKMRLDTPSRALIPSDGMFADCAAWQDLKPMEISHYISDVLGFQRL